MRYVRVDSYTYSLRDIVGYVNRGLILVGENTYTGEELTTFLDGILLGIPVPTVHTEVDKFGKESIVAGERILTTLYRFRNSQLTYTSKVNPTLTGKTLDAYPYNYRANLERYTSIQVQAIKYDTSEDDKIIIRRYWSLNR